MPTFKTLNFVTVLFDVKKKKKKNLLVVTIVTTIKLLDALQLIFLQLYAFLNVVMSWRLRDHIKLSKLSQVFIKQGNCQLICIFVLSLTAIIEMFALSKHFFSHIFVLISCSEVLGVVLQPCPSVNHLFHCLLFRSLT